MPTHQIDQFAAAGAAAAAVARSGLHGRPLIGLQLSASELQESAPE